MTKLQIQRFIYVPLSKQRMIFQIYPGLQISAICTQREGRGGGFLIRFCAIKGEERSYTRPLQTLRKNKSVISMAAGAREAPPGLQDSRTLAVGEGFRVRWAPGNGSSSRLRKPSSA
ncbi:Hypothetical predicted protein [Marmota monax]|uniref:Uncharacterized protein n=1 Tax=Marmota monax TaxID=9995 RepID=A0A5E4AJG3_MARMO|nr:hypothetical protein GHT09_018803 [Marmota monax]VTJ56622.1 Hypothetical predicted protein [Marmota monax]